MEKLSRLKRQLVEEALKETGSTDSHELCDYISKSIESRYDDERSQMIAQKRMNLNNTGDILAMIRQYMEEAESKGRKSKKLPERSRTLWG